MIHLYLLLLLNKPFNQSCFSAGVFVHLIGGATCLVQLLLVTSSNKNRQREALEHRVVKEKVDKESPYDQPVKVGLDFGPFKESEPDQTQSIDRKNR